MRWTLVLLAACVNDDLSADDASAPPNPCAVVADHVVTPVAMGGGGGGGGGGGVVTYSTSTMFQTLVRNVSPGDSVGFQVNLAPGMYATREDALTASVSLTGNGQGVAPTLMPVLSAVSGGSMGMTQGIATFTPPSAGQPAGFHWVADLGPLAYGDVQSCLGVVVELPVNPLVGILSNHWEILLFLPAPQINLKSPLSQKVLAIIRIPHSPPGSLGTTTNGQSLWLKVTSLVLIRTSLLLIPFISIK